MESIHKLTAGDGYAYLTRQVAALDHTDRGHTGLGEYYTQHGEAPGWGPLWPTWTCRSGSWSPRTKWLPCSPRACTRTPTRSAPR